MVNYTYTYLIGALILLVPWIILFLWRKDTRKEMLIISIIFGFIGVLFESITMLDWWRPLTITGTLPSIEDFIYTFAIAGIGAVAYSVIFNKKVKIKKRSEKTEFKRNLNFGFLGLMGILIFFGSFFILKLNTLIAFIIGALIPIFIIWIKRKDLILSSIISGFLLLIISAPVYYLLELISPGWIDAFWYFQNTPKIILFWVPIDDIIFYFLSGLLLGPLYEYWQEGRLVNKK
tara:strand:- start:1209 stop:1907 length:699 start_codon:yes stop_codon:yes gene_type:complete